MHVTGPYGTSTLHVRGTLPDRPWIAVIGSREADQAGLDIAAHAATLISERAALISGLARGVDHAAHQAATGPQVAALPSHWTRLYPAEHAALAERITAEGGALLSEHGPSAALQKSHFVTRNAVIARHASALILICTGTTGGSWHATHRAAQLGMPLAIITPQTSASCWDGNRNVARAAATGGLWRIMSGSTNVKLVAPEDLSAWINTALKHRHAQAPRLLTEHSPPPARART